MPTIHPNDDSEVIEISPSGVVWDPIKDKIVSHWPAGLPFKEASDFLMRLPEGLDHDHAAIILGMIRSNVSIMLAELENLENAKLDKKTVAAIAPLMTIVRFVCAEMVPNPEDDGWKPKRRRRRSPNGTSAAKTEKDDAEVTVVDPEQEMIKEFVDPKTIKSEDMKETK